MSNGTASSFIGDGVGDDLDGDGDARCGLRRRGDGDGDGGRGCGMGPAWATRQRARTFEVDTKGPGLSTAVVAGNALVLTYDEDLDASSVPAGSAYTVKAGPSGSLAPVNLAGTNPVTVSGRTVTLTLASAVASGDVVVTVSYTAPVANPNQDALGNATVNLADGAVVNNTAKPTVVIASTGTFPMKDPFGVTLEFSVVVSGFALDDIEASNGTATSLTETMSGTTWTVTVTPDADYAGAVTVSVAADAATNGTGVGNAAASADFEADTKGPGLSTAVVAGNTLVLTYNEDLDASSVPAGSAYTVKAEGSAVALAASGAVTVSGRTVTLTLASAVLTTDTVTASYTAPGTNKLQDALGNAVGALMDRAVVNDTAKPTLAIASTDTFPTKDPFDVTLGFSAVVSGFAQGDIEVSNGTASSFIETVSGTTWTVTVTPDADYAGAVTVTVAADAATNGSGVGNAAANAAFAVDTKGPGLSTAVVAGNTLVLTYDEDLDASSVPAGSAYTVQAGPSGSLATVNLAGTNPVTVSGRTVTLTLASAVASGDAVVTVSYTAPGTNKLQDAQGNAAGALMDRAVVNDTAKPTVTIESMNTFPTKDAFTVTLEFSDAVTGFAQGDIEVTNGTASSLTETVTGTTWTVTVTPDADYAGAVTVTVAADAAVDGNGVGNAAANADFEADTKGPGLSTAVVAGNTLVLTYDEDLDASSVPAGSAYTVQAGPSGSLATVNLAGTNPVTVSGRTVTLTLASAVASGDAVTVSYTAPGTNKLQDAQGNAAVNLADEAVTNNTMERDDDDEPELTLVLSRNTVDENGGSITVAAVLSKPLSDETQIEITLSQSEGDIGSNGGRVGTANVDLKISGTAERGIEAKRGVARADSVTLINNVLTIPAGQLKSINTVTILATDDENDTPNQAFRISGTTINENGAELHAEVPLMFIDDDGEPNATLVVWPHEISERDGIATVSAIVQPPAEQEIEIEVSAMAVPPAGPEAFALSAERTLTVRPGATESIGRVTVAAGEDEESNLDWQVEVSGAILNIDDMPDPDSVVLTIRDDANSVPAMLSLAAGAYADEGNEGTQSLDFTVTLSRRADRQITVGYTTVDDTAVAGEDYEAASGVLTFNQGEASQTFSVVVRGDSEPESDERFKAVLMSPTGGAVLATREAYGVIGNDDSVAVAQPARDLCSYAPSTSQRMVSVDDATAEEGDPARFRITMDRRRSCQDTSFWVTTFPGTATGEADYAGLQDHLVHLEAGDTEVFVEVPTFADEIIDYGESFWVRIRVAGTLWRSTEQVRDTAIGSIRDADEPSQRIPLFPAAGNAMQREGLIRIVNFGDTSATVEIVAFDESGLGYEPVSLAVGPAETVHVTSRDLEEGNPAKGLTGSTGRPAQGDWRLDLYVGDHQIKAYTYLRTADGFLTSLHDVAPEAEPPSAGALPRDVTYPVPVFYAGSNPYQQSSLRLVNAGEETATVVIRGVDDEVAEVGPVQFSLQGGETRTIMAADLESGAGMDGGLGTGTGIWRLTVTADRPLWVLNLLEVPFGYLSNLSAMPDNKEFPDANGDGEPGAEERRDAGQMYRVPLFPSATGFDGRQGFVRVINQSHVGGSVAIKAYNGSGWDYDFISMEIGAGEALYFNSDDLESGNPANGLARGVGAGEGDWWLELTSTLDLDVFSYVRIEDGLLTAMHDTVPASADGYTVPTFNPGTNVNQVSSLLLLNPGEESAAVAIRGIDDAGLSSSGEARLSVPGGTARAVTARQLESGGEGIDGALGDGTGKWRLIVTSDRPILVLSLLASPTGHLINLSTAPD